ncbi:hypothetical protein ACN47E_006207 [Coniothyrium glycines]
MSTTFATSRRRITLTTTIPQSPSLILATAISSFTVEFSLLELDTGSPVQTPPPVAGSVNPSTTSPNVDAGATCTSDVDCTINTTCKNERCIAVTDSSAIGGLGPEPTSRLNTASAIGVGVGVIALLAVLIALIVWCFKVRGRSQAKGLVEGSLQSRVRSASNATDQKTLVASLPNSPQNAAFHHHNTMRPGIFVKAFEYNESAKEKAEYRKSIASIDTSDCRSIATNKALPSVPHSENPLPPPPVEPKRYAINVNINKSMIFDDEGLIRAVSPLRDSDCSTPRERTPQYRFKEYLSPSTRTPRISITRQSTSNMRNSEYELEHYPQNKQSSTLESTQDEESNAETDRASIEQCEPSTTTNKVPQLPLPDLPPPSPSFSFRSYDWYQDIISDQPNGERTPTQAIFPKNLTPSPSISASHGHLVPEPLSPSGSTFSTVLHLHPGSAPSPANTGYRLPSTVYQAPAHSSKSPRLPPQPLSPESKPSHISALSTMTRQTYNSRSWLPDDGLYLPEDGNVDMYKKFRRPSDANRPTSYSPLT